MGANIHITGKSNEKYLRLRSFIPFVKRVAFIDLAEPTSGGQFFRMFSIRARVRHAYLREDSPYAIYDIAYFGMEKDMEEAMEAVEWNLKKKKDYINERRAIMNEFCEFVKKEENEELITWTEEIHRIDRSESA